MCARNALLEPAGVGADEQRRTVPVLIRDLRQCRIQHRDVVGGGALTILKSRGLAAMLLDE
jgi:hypothetical protein